MRAGGPRGGITVLNEMTREERLLLLRFVCSFAWADDQMREEERALVRRYVDKLRLDDSEQSQVQEWLSRPPPAEPLAARSDSLMHRSTRLAVLQDPEPELARRMRANHAATESAFGSGRSPGGR